MGFLLDSIQGELARRKLDGWLFYDFHGRDPIAYRVLGLNLGMVTRRWYYFIPAQGEPKKLVHRIEAAQLDSLPGEKHLYAKWDEQREKLGMILGPARKIAMQYSPENAIPYVSMVDAGTIELVKSLGKEVLSSADLVQRFEARWSREQWESHQAAGKVIDSIMASTFREIGIRVAEGRNATEYDVQQWILRQFESNGLVTDEPPIVAVNEHSGDPHFEPQATSQRPIQPEDWVLLDMWAKQKKPSGVYYDITWVGYLGQQVPKEHQKIFAVVREARDTAVAFVQQSLARGERLRGFQVDDAARSVIEKQGFGEYFIHRTGHSIGAEVHSTGANMDNLETHDDREIIPNTCFSIEPGIYLPEFGVRLEVDVFVGEGEAQVTGPVQQQVVRIDGGK